jgi:tRNA A-37 threonylcarbamoyl transferase component Bud32
MAFPVLGLITSDAGVVGFVLARIPAKYPTLQPVITGRLAGDTPSLALRQEWASQIEHIVRELHRHDIVWGDAKPDNVLIDHDDNAWVLDFHGGVTQGWVERSMLETKEGDLHALAKMKAPLHQADIARQGGPSGGSRDGAAVENSVRVAV